MTCQHCDFDDVDHDESECAPMPTVPMWNSKRAIVWCDLVAEMAAEAEEAQ